MAQATFSVRMDETLKEQFDELCKDFGMNMTTAINVFARSVVRNRKIPFEIASTEPKITQDGARRAMAALRAQARESGASDMTLDEVNDEISLARIERGGL